MLTITSVLIAGRFFTTLIFLRTYFSSLLGVPHQISGSISKTAILSPRFIVAESSEAPQGRTQIQALVALFY